MQMIVCEVHPFNLNQSVFMITDDNRIVPLGLTTFQSLGSTIAHECYRNQIYEVHLVGPASYIQKTINDIGYYEMQNYNEKKIKIEVN